MAAFSKRVIRRGSRIRVLVVDDHPGWNEALQALLGGEARGVRIGRRGERLDLHDLHVVLGDADVEAQVADRHVVDLVAGQQLGGLLGRHHHLGQVLGGELAPLQRGGAGLPVEGSTAWAYAIVGTLQMSGTMWAQHPERSLDTLSDDLTDDAWRLWFVDWNATSGEHRLQVRATDKSGYTQTDEIASVAPDGATGWHTRSVDVD